MGGPGVGSVVKKADMPKVLVDTDKGKICFQACSAATCASKLRKLASCTCWRTPCMILQNPGCMPKCYPTNPLSADPYLCAMSCLPMVGAAARVSASGLHSQSHPMSMTVPYYHDTKAQHCFVWTCALPFYSKQNDQFTLYYAVPI